MQRRQFLRKGLLFGTAGLLPGTAVSASPLSADSSPITGLVLPPLNASGVNDLLIHFVEKEQLEAVKSLLGQGVDVNGQNENGWTPLHHAAIHNSNATVVEYLISQGADVNARDEVGRTPLHNAALSGSVEIIQYLISQDADVNAKDNDGWTPLGIINENEKAEETKRVLRKAEAKE